MNDKFGDKKYYKIPVIKFQQKNKTFYVGKLTINVLEEISTLRPVEKIEKEEKYIEESNLSNLFGLIGTKKEKIKDDSFNRPQDLKRALEITEYIETDENALIPNAIIVGGEEKKLDIDDEYNIDFSEDLIADSDWLDSFNNMNGIFINNNHLYIPHNEISLVIIDGQHRFLGLEKLPVEIKEKFEVPISFLIGYNQIEMAEIFYTINYTQKSVDKSLLTHLKNSFLNKVTESSMIYEYIKFLNTNEDSALKDKIKTIKGDKGLISLSYLHAEINNLVKRYSKQSTKIPILTKLFNDEENGYIVLQILLNYFNAIENTLRNKFSTDLWESKNSVFTKTIGIGAFLQILPYLILKILDDNNKLSDYLYIKNITVEDFSNILKEIIDINLTEFEKGGGLGLLGKLKNEMIKKMSLSNYNKDFVLNKKISWIEEFYLEKGKTKSPAP